MLNLTNLFAYTNQFKNRPLFLFVYNKKVVLIFVNYSTQRQISKHEEQLRMNNIYIPISKIRPNHSHACTLFHSIIL